MKKAGVLIVCTVFGAAFAARSAPEVLAGWWDPSSSIDVQAQGISASKDTTGWGEPAHGCGDDTFGSFAGASHDETAPGSYYDKSSNTLSMAFTVLNASTNGYTVDYLSLDTFRQYADAKDHWSLSIVGGDLGTTNNALSGEITRISGAIYGAETNDFTDLDINLSALGLLLGIGQSVTIQVDFSDTTPEAIGNLFIDNMAVLGTVVTQQVSNAVLAGWCEPSNAVDVTAPGFTASKNTTGWGEPPHGCNDDTFGNFAGASHDTVSPGSFWNNKTTSPMSMQFQLANGSFDAYELNFLSFDAWRVYSDAMDHWSLSIVDGDLGTTNNILSGTIERIAAGPSADEENDFLDIDISLSDFELVLSVGESVTFQLDFTDTTPSADGNLFIDNIAVIGSVYVPQYDNAYDEWAAGWGAALGAATNDFDGDGVDNLSEYALGGDPTDALQSGTSPEFYSVGSDMEYIYLQRNDTNLSSWLEIAENLVDGGWTNSGYTVTGTNVTGGTFDAITNSLPADTDRKFIRLMLEYQ